MVSHLQSIFNILQVLIRFLNQLFWSEFGGTKTIMYCFHILESTAIMFIQIPCKLPWVNVWPTNNSFVKLKFQFCFPFYYPFPYQGVPHWQVNSSGVICKCHLVLMGGKVLNFVCKLQKDHCCTGATLTKDRNEDATRAVN